MTSRVPALIVHGGAGAGPADGPEELREGITQAVAAGWRPLSEGGTALDAAHARGPHVAGALGARDSVLRGRARP